MANSRAVQEYLSRAFRRIREARPLNPHAGLSIKPSAGRDAIFAITKKTCCRFTSLQHLFRAALQKWKTRNVSSRQLALPLPLCRPAARRVLTQAGGVMGDTRSMDSRKCLGHHRKGTPGIGNGYYVINVG